MDILGVGPMELILVLIIALLVFGPARLPEMGARLGKMVRTMRSATREFSKEIEQARQEIEGPIREAGQPLQEMRDSVKQLAPAAQALAHPQETIRSAVLKELGAGDGDKPVEGEQGAAVTTAEPVDGAGPVRPMPTPESVSSSLAAEDMTAIAAEEDAPIPDVMPDSPVIDASLEATELPAEPPASASEPPVPAGPAAEDRITEAAEASAPISSVMPDGMAVEVPPEAPEPPAESRASASESPVPPAVEE